MQTASNTVKVESASPGRLLYFHICPAVKTGSLVICNNGALTKREKEILQVMAIGVNSDNIAEKLHISETTVSTHRRNIKRKLKVKSNYDITRFVQAFDLI